MNFIFQATGGELEFIVFLSRATGPVLMAIIIYGAIKEWWVPGAVFRRVLAERNEWKDIALTSRQLTERSVHVAEQMVEKTDEKR